MDEKKPNEEKPITPFQSSIFNQMEELRKIEGITLEEEWKIDPEDLRYSLEMPFDVVASITGCKELALTEKQALHLSKTWKNPLERLAKKYPAIKDMDIYMACTSTLAIIAEKGLAYRIYKQSDNNNTRDARQGKDELSKVSS